MLEAILQSPEFRAAATKVRTTTYLHDVRQFHDRRHTFGDAAVFFPVSDLSHAVQLYHQQLIRKNRLVFGISSEPRQVIVQNGWLFLFLEPDRPVIFDEVTKKTRDTAACHELLKREEHLRNKLSLFLSASPETVEEGDYTLLFNSMTTYGSMILDVLVRPWIVQYILDLRGKHLPEKERVQLANDLLFPTDETPYLGVFYSGLLGLAINYTKERLTQHDIRQFIHSVGYLDRVDVLPCDYENEAFVMRKVRQIAGNASPEDIAEQRYDFYRSGAFARMRQRHARQRILDLYEKKDSDYQDTENYLAFASCAMNYNEHNRRLRTAFFRFTERWMKSRGLNPHSDALPLACYDTPTPASVASCFERATV